MLDKHKIKKKWSWIATASAALLVAGVLVGGTVIKTQHAALAGDKAFSEQETKAAEKAAKAQEKAAKEIAKAQEKAAKEEAKAQEKGTKAQEKAAKAQEKAAKEIAKAQEKAAKEARKEHWLGSFALPDNEQDRVAWLENEWAKRYRDVNIADSCLIHGGALWACHLKEISSPNPQGFELHMDVTNGFGKDRGYANKVAGQAIGGVCSLSSGSGLALKGKIVDVRDITGLTIKRAVCN